MKQRIPRTTQSTRPTLDFETAIFAIRRCPKSGKIIEVQVYIVRDHEIDESITVIISESRAGRPSPVTNAGFRSNIGEGSIAIIFI